MKFTYGISTTLMTILYVFYNILTVHRYNLDNNKRKKERSENSERPDIIYTELRKSLTLCHIRRLREGQKAKRDGRDFTDKLNLQESDMTTSKIKEKVMRVV